MPFINGRYYMNPAYGRGLEAARDAEAKARALETERPDGDADLAAIDPWEEDYGTHLITQDGRRIPARGRSQTQGPPDATNNPVYEKPDPSNKREVELANIVYNETSGLRVDPNARPGAPGSPEDLQKARMAIAEIANRVIAGGHPERILVPTDLSAQEVEAINGGNAGAIAAHNGSLAAARQALAGSNFTNDATQYRTRFGEDIETPVGRTPTLPGSRVSQHFGPLPAGRGQRQVVVVAH